MKRGREEGGEEEEEERSEERIAFSGKKRILMNFVKNSVVSVSFQLQTTIRLKLV
jgi:hypothetical protein